MCISQMYVAVKGGLDGEPKSESFYLTPFVIPLRAGITRPFLL